jgi:hypothetical protein
VKRELNIENDWGQDEIYGRIVEVEGIFKYE